MCNAQNIPLYEDSIHFSASIPFTDFQGNTATAEGDYYVYKACGNTCIKNPIIIVEGIDPTNSRYWNEIYTAMNQENLAEKFHDEGYDIIMLNFTNSVDYIERNSMLLVELINRVNSGQIVGNSNCSGTPNPNVVIGPSMGALICRYGLAYMEYHNIIHNTRLYISFDGPNNGANIPLGFQQLTEWSTSGLDNYTVDLGQFLQKIKDGLQDSPAAKEMLIEHYNSSAATFRQSFKNNLLAVGNYPNNCRKVAIADGSGNSTGQGFSGSDKLFDYHHNSNGTTSTIKFDLEIWSRPGNYIQVFPPNNDPLYDFSQWLKGSLKVPCLSPTCVLLNGMSTWNEVLAIDKKGNAGNLSNYKCIDNVPGGQGNSPQLISDMINSSSTTVKIKGLINFSIAGTNFNFSPTVVDLDKTATTPSGNNISFIPTISALDINTTDYWTNIFQIPGYPNSISHSITPFDAVYASMTNLPHVLEGGIDQGIADFVTEEIGSVCKFTSGVITNDYNFGVCTSSCCRMVNELSCDVSVQNNSTLSFNKDSKIKFNLPSGTCPNPINGSVLNVKVTKGSRVTITLGSKLEIGDNSTNNEANIEFIHGSNLLVENNALLKIAQNSSLTLLGNSVFESKIKSGATLHIFSNGKLIVKGGHVLAIEPNANVTLEDGASIVVEPNSKLIMGDGQVFLNGSNASVYIKGTLEIPANTDLTLNGTGFYQFGVGNNIVMGQGSKVNIVGQGNTDEVIKIDDNATVMIQNHDVKIKDADMLYGQYAKFTIVGGLHTEIQNINAYNGSNSHGINAFDISNANSVVIESSTFTDFSDALNIHDYAIDCGNLLSKPMIMIKTCNFNNSIGADIVAHNLQRTDLTIQSSVLTNASTINGIDLLNCNKVEIIGVDITHKTNDGIVANNVNQLIIEGGHINSNQLNGVEANNANVYARNGAVIEYNVNDGININNGGNINPLVASSLTIGDWGCAWIIHNGGYGVNIMDCYLYADAYEHSVVNGSAIKSNRFDGNGLTILPNTGIAMKINYSYPFWNTNLALLKTMSFKNNYWGLPNYQFNGSICFNSYSTPTCLNAQSVVSNPNYPDAQNYLSSIPTGCNIGGFDPTEIDPYDPNNSSARLSHTNIEIPQELVDATLLSEEPAGRIFAMAYRKMLANNIDEATFMLADYLSVADPTTLPDLRFEATQQLAAKLAAQLYALDPCTSPYDPSQQPAERKAKLNTIKQAIALRAAKNNIAKGITIFPNPFESSTTVNFTNDTKETFVCRVYNMQGQSVKTIENIESNSFTIDASMMPKGMYWIELKSKTKAYRERLVVE
jgi:hypothetical protein